MVGSSFIIAIWTSLVAVAAARQCRELTIPLNITAENGVFQIQVPETNVEVTDLFLNLARAGVVYQQTVKTGQAPISAKYKIAATYCQPKSGPGKALQILTHGVGFDRSYWDFPAHNYNYSYVNAALDRGYSTFAFDRPGIGQSSHGDPLTEVQEALEIAALATLTAELRAGRIHGAGPGFQRVVHVGHSFGSIQTYGVTARGTAASDGIVLTGFSASSTYVPYFYLGGNWVQADTLHPLAGYSDGYFAAGNTVGLQSNFFAPGNFDPRILKAAYAAGQPVSIGEVLSLGSALAQSSNFTGPVLVITGDNDLPFCGGNCTVTTPGPVDLLQGLFEETTIETYIVPNTGHGLNLEYTWPITYKTIHDFFDKHQ